MGEGRLGVAGIKGHSKGGAAVTDDAALAERIQLLSLHGMSRDAWSRYGAGGTPHYDVVMPGYKYNMMDIQAAMGIHQLERVEDNWRRRR
jgi:dTDP-4-amino-4,6-dideoxygalactose transaminase